MSKRGLVVFLLGLLTLLAWPTFSALAQDGQPPVGDGATWGDFFNPDGSLATGVTDTGVVYQDANWMPQFPDWTGLNLQAEYHQYVAPDGSTMLMPTQTTFFFAQYDGDSPFYNNDAWVGAAGGVQLDTDYSTGSWLGNLWSAVTGFVMPDQQADTSITGSFANWTLFGFGDAWETLALMANLSQQDDSLYMNAWIFDNCASSPTGCSPQAAALMASLVTNTPEPTATDDPFVTPPPPASCPGISVSQAAPTMSIAPGDPPYPVVVGQDPDKRGADVTGQITLPPIIVTWYEPRYEQDWGCVGPKFPGDAPCVRGRRQMVTYLAECIAHHEAVPEQITSVVATATLSAASRNWISSDLGSKWYGAYIHQGSFNLMAFGASGTSCSVDGVCRAVIEARGVPFADPGYFDLLLRVSTNGAFWRGQRVTAPRSISTSGRLGVSVILPTLIDASTQP